jgi:hypothetical protein
MIVSNCLKIHPREIILTNENFKDGIEIEMKWVAMIKGPKKLAKIFKPNKNKHGIFKP